MDSKTDIPLLADKNEMEIIREQIRERRKLEGEDRVALSTRRSRPRQCKPIKIEDKIQGALFLNMQLF